MITQMFSITIDESGKGKRLDKFLAEKITGYSRSYFQNLVKKGNITVNGERVEKDYLLVAGDKITVLIEEAESVSLEPDNNIRFEIIFDGNDFAVINKPAGLVVHPSHTHKKGTLVNGLLARWPEIKKVGEDHFRPGIVHRLDKETSGLMVVAKSQPMFFWLKKQFQDRKVEKKYIALVFGKMRQSEGIIEIPIGRIGAKQVAILPINKGFSGNVYKSRKARTGFKILAYLSGLSAIDGKKLDLSLIEAIPYTGRMHQIRVHFKHIGHSLVGDKKYAGGRQFKAFPLTRHFLHASYLALELPDGKRVEFRSDLPADLKEVLRGLQTV